MVESNIKDYLPKFLSGSSNEELFSCLKDFPDNIGSRFYSELVFKVKNTGIQGDGMDGFLFFNWKNNGMIKSNAIILSNSCDISFENERTDTPFISYCPIISLAN
ncbi:MAG: hypothetical protein FWF67_01070 [Fibromonadales bacterium]|nr:hypothetical protein [Fibromonadales bacterium]